MPAIKIRQMRMKLAVTIRQTPIDPAVIIRQTPIDPAIIISQMPKNNSALASGLFVWSFADADICFALPMLSTKLFVPES